MKSEIEEKTIQAVRIIEDGNIIPIQKGDPWIEGVEAYLAIGGLAGNCLWVILSCTVAPNPFHVV